MSRDDAGALNAWICKPTPCFSRFSRLLWRVNFVVSFNDARGLQRRLRGTSKRGHEPAEAALVAQSGAAACAYGLLARTPREPLQAPARRLRPDPTSAASPMEPSTRD